MKNQVKSLDSWLNFQYSIFVRNYNSINQGRSHYSEVLHVHIIYVNGVLTLQGNVLSLISIF